MKPIDETGARLDDYVRGQMADAEAEGFEAELFARAMTEEAPELALRQQLERRFREMNGRGTLSLWLTEREADKLTSSGLRVMRFDFDVENPSLPDVSSDFDILVTRIPVPLEGVRSLDAEILSPSGEVIKVMRDIDFEPSTNAVFACCERELAIKAAQARTITRVWARGDTNEKRLLLEIPASI